LLPASASVLVARRISGTWPHRSRTRPRSKVQFPPVPLAH
jgi:hypothetical protein